MSSTDFDPSTDFDLEIARLNEELVRNNQVACDTFGLLCSQGQLTDKQSLRFRYYRSLVLFTHCRIKFWEQAKANHFDANMLEKINETMTDMLEANGEYLGQANIKEERELAISVYEKCKSWFDSGTIKIKKKTRRGGKKHKK